jgi:hypothetical protein
LIPIGKESPLRAAILFFEAERSAVIARNAGISSVVSRGHPARSWTQVSDCHCLTITRLGKRAQKGTARQSRCVILQDYFPTMSDSRRRFFHAALFSVTNFFSTTLRQNRKTSSISQFKT